MHKRSIVPSRIFFLIGEAQKAITTMAMSKANFPVTYNICFICLIIIWKSIFAATPKMVIVLELTSGDFRNSLDY